MDTTSSKQKSRTKVRYWVIAAIATVLLVGVKLIFEHTSSGYQHEIWVFGKMQNLLPQIDLDNPVVVLDISGLPGGKPAEPTPRKDLKEIISALAKLQSPPRAIAVDINFSPKGPNYSAKEDEEFFDFCLSVSNNQKVPVFLAVAETKSAPPEAWLGNEKYKDLAVAAAGDINDASRIPLWVKSPYSSEKLVSLSYALAREYRNRLPRADWWIRWAVDEHTPEAEDDPHHEKTSVEGEATLIYEERLVNYSKLDQMKEAAHPDTKADAIERAAQKYSDRVVILGDLNSADKVPIPGRLIDQQGSLVLASATYTLIKEPLFQFKGWMRVLLDFVIGAVIIGAVARFRTKFSGDVLERKQKLFVWAAVLVVSLLGFGLVIGAGILWLDFILVALALLLHPRAEHWVDRIIEKIRPEESTPPDVVPPESPATNQPAGGQIAAATKSTTVALLFCVMALSGHVSAQQRVASPPRCEKAIAAIGLGLKVPPQKSKKKKPVTCYVRQNRDAAWQPLTADTVQRQYRAGEHIYCDADCSLAILYCGTQTQQIVDTRKPDWFPVIHAFRPPPPLLDPKKNNLLRLSQFVSPPDPSTLNEGEARVFFSAIPSVSYGVSRKAKPRIDPSRSATTTSNAGTETGGRETSSSAQPGGRRENARTEASTTGVPHPSTASSTPVATATPTASATAATSAPATAATPATAVVPAPAPATVPATAPVTAPAPAPATATETASETAAEREQEFLELLRDANLAHRNKDYAVARQFYLDAQKIRPDDYRVPQGLGNLYADQKDWSAAEQAYRDALKLRPNRSFLNLSLAFVMFQAMVASGNNSRAPELEQVLHRAVASNPRNPAVYELFEQFFESQNAAASSMEPVLRAAASYMPHSVTTNLRLAQVLYRLGKPEEALDYVRRAETLALDRTEPQGLSKISAHRRYDDLMLVAQSYQANGRYKDAERIVKKALELKPNDPVALYNLGSVMVQRKHFEQALTPLQEASRLQPDKFAPVFVLGIAQLGNGNLAAAEASFDNASTRVNDEADGIQRLAYWFSALGDAYRSKGRLPDAVRAYEKSLKHVAENPDTRARLLKVQGKHDSKTP